MIDWTWALAAFYFGIYVHMVWVRVDARLKAAERQEKLR